MGVNWDPEKAKSNYKKHGVHFSDAESVLYDPCALTIEDENSEGEHRYVSIGLDAISRILVIVYAQISDDIRLISARKAGKNERSNYEEGI
ncbi:MAG: BrnT family toxin [Gammaproteobacteria bacterium]|nr:MAG: BrnT family toxin [Gammaproteobacteria bacterium]